jgi:hypothetical protein
MVRVVVDTNILGGKKARPLGSNDMLRLLDETRRGNLVLVLPEVVVRESANLWAELVVKKVDSYEDLRAFLVRAEMVADGDPLAIDKTEVRGTEESRLRRLLEEAGGRTAPLPMVEHDAVVERALRREQPFESKGRDGYRDVILWETLLAMAAEDGPIVFISNDHRAFFDRDSSKGLSGKLRDEFQSRAVEGATIDLFSEVGPGTDTALEKAAAEVERKAAIAAQEQANAETLERRTLWLRRTWGSRRSSRRRSKKPSAPGSSVRTCADMASPTPTCIRPTSTWSSRWVISTFVGPIDSRRAECWPTWSPRLSCRRP